MKRIMIIFTTVFLLLINNTYSQTVLDLGNSPQILQLKQEMSEIKESRENVRKEKKSLISEYKNIKIRKERETNKKKIEQVQIEIYAIWDKQNLLEKKSNNLKNKYIDIEYKWAKEVLSFDEPQEVLKKIKNAKTPLEAKNIRLAYIDSLFLYVYMKYKHIENRKEKIEKSKSENETIKDIDKAFSIILPYRKEDWYKKED
jgi:uncharacterized protein (DUF3084 family)